MPVIERIKELKKTLLNLKFGNKENSHASGTVGFTQNYALAVHETHRKKSKYLEQPARTKRNELGTIVVKGMKATKSLEKALIIAGLNLQIASQKLVPVDTGALKASAFTSLTRNTEAVAGRAFEKSELVKKKAISAREKKKK